jgi:hypothetical protein
MTRELHGASSYCGMDISCDGDIAVITGDCVRHLHWNDKNMEMIYSSNKLSNEVDVETIAPVLQTFRAPEVLCAKFSPATVSPNGRALLAASTSVGEIYVLRAPQLGVASCWLTHCDLTNTVLDHLHAQPELEQTLNTAEPSSQFIVAARESESVTASDAGATSGASASHNQRESGAASQQRLLEQEIIDDAKRKTEALEKLKRKLAEAEAACKYADAMKAIGGGSAQASKDAEEAAAAAAQAARAVAAASEAAEAAMALSKKLASNRQQQQPPPSCPHPDSQQCDANAALLASSAAAAEAIDLDAFSGSKRNRCVLESGDTVSSAGSGTPRTPAAYATKTPGYISKFAMDSRVAGASDQLARIIKAMQKLFLLERSRLPSHLQVSYGSWNKFSEQDQNLMSMCFDRVYSAEEECIRKFQLEDVCTTKRLQQHVRIALRKYEEGGYTGEVADEVERNLFNDANQQQAVGLVATPSGSNLAPNAVGRSGAVGAQDTPVPSQKKSQFTTPKHTEDRVLEKNKGLGGAKPSYGQMLAMQCRVMCVHVTS